MPPAHADRGQPTWATQDDDGLVKQPHPLRLPLRHIPRKMHLRRQRGAAQRSQLRDSSKTPRQSAAARPDAGRSGRARERQERAGRANECGCPLHAWTEFNVLQEMDRQRTPAT